MIFVFLFYFIFFLYAMVKTKPDTLLFSNLRVKRGRKSTRSLVNPKKEKLLVLPSLLFQEIEVLPIKVLTKPL